MKPQRYTLHANDSGRALVLANAHAFLDRLPPAKSWRIEVSQLRKIRSPKQRKALFGVAYAAIMEFMGLEGSDDKKELHKFFCGEFFGWRDERDILGRQIPERTTTTNERGEHEEIDTDTALRMYAFIQRKAAEHGIDVPDPDPLFAEHANT